MYNHFAGDPYWTRAKECKACTGCGFIAKPGHRVFVYPRTGSVYCHECGQLEYERFQEAARLEYMQTGPELWEPDDDDDDLYPDDYVIGLAD